MELNHFLPDTYGDIERVTANDEKKIAGFLTQNIRFHRHLDWFETLDWLGEQPFLMEVSKDRIFSILCAVKENNEAAWIRAFGIQKIIPFIPHWHNLLTEAIQDLATFGVKEIASLAFDPWFDNLLGETGFSHRQDVIVLELSHASEPSRKIKSDLEIRQMQIDDLSDVYEIDRLAFPPIWQNSIKALNRAFDQTGVHTVATVDGRVVGYQISTTMTIYGHLARLAIHPNFQRQGIAYSLLEDLLENFKQQGLWRVTVNTQSDNHASMRLYQSLGFSPTGEEIPVYTKQVV